ncbi:MAG: hypothetical protein R2745_17715 [Vicinamibacterales bacterium]
MRVASAALLALGTLAAGQPDRPGHGASDAEIERVLAVARGDAAARAAFHRAYGLEIEHPVVERIEIVTERRRLALIAEARLAAGDWAFARGLWRAREALRPWRRKVAIVGRLRFPPQNAYVLAPPLDLDLIGRAGRLPRLALEGATVFGLGTGAPNERLPVAGATVEALFDADVADTAREVVLRADGVELVRLALDVSRQP